MMKRITMILMVLAALVTFAACGAKQAGGSDVEPEPELTAEETFALPEEETIAAPEDETAAAEETETDASGAWMAAYRDYLLKVIPDIVDSEDPSEFIRFGFIHLNDDDVPELWYNDGLGAHGPSYVIRTYRDGKVAEVGDGCNVLEYYEKQGVFFFTGSGGASGYGVTYYKMTGNGCEQLDDYTEFIDASVAPDQDGNMTVVRRLNDVEISEEEHQALLDRYASRYGQSTRVNSDDGFQLTKENVLANCK